MAILYTEAKNSPVGKVNSTDLKEWGNNLLIFLAGLALVYLLQLNGVLQNRNLAWNDLIPTQMTWGAIELYVFNAIIGLLKKFTNT